MLFVWTALSGWVATCLLAIGIAIPYLARAMSQRGPSYSARLKAHYCCGFLILAVAFLHAWLPMSAGHVRAYDQSGMLVATLALFVIFWQVIHGLALRRAQGAVRTDARLMHFRTMLCIAGLVVTHIVLNRA